MPIYEYRCEQCDHQFDALQKISDDELTDCPACSQPALKKLVSAPNFRLKGGGWYETDFKKDNKRNLADSGGDKPATDGESKGKSDSASGDGAKSAGNDAGKSAGASASAKNADGGKSRSSGDGGKAA